MARDAKKQEKPDEGALKALEEALTINFDDDAENNSREIFPEVSVGEPDFQDLEDKLAAAAMDLNSELDIASTEDPALTHPNPQSGVVAAEKVFPSDMTPIPANDEHDEQLARLHHLLQKKASARPLWIASFLSVIWLAICGYYIYGSLLPTLDTGKPLLNLISDPTFQLSAVAVVAPLMLFWAFAILVRRTQEMRNAAASMSEAALRLLRPDEVATDSITSVGRAIRREVAAIGDGVERAIARAGELEYLVQNEVMNLERSYGDSEYRLKNLVHEISAEREEIIGHAEKLKNSISQSHLGLTSELETAGGKIEDTARQIADQLTQSLDMGRDTLSSSLNETGATLISTLTTTTEELNKRIEAGRSDLESNISLKAGEISEVIKSAGNAVATLIDTQSVNLQQQNNQVTRQLEDALAMRSSEFESRVKEAGEVVEATLNAKLNAIDASLKTGGSNLVAALGTRSEALDKLLKKRTDAIGEALEIRSTEFSSRIAEAGEQVQNQIDIKLDAIDASVKSGGSQLVAALGTKTEELDKVLKNSSEAIGKTMEGRLSGFDTALTGHVNSAVEKMQAQTLTLERNTRAVGDIITKRTKSVENVIKQGTIDLAKTIDDSVDMISTKSTDMTNVLAQRANAIHESLGENLAASQRTLEDKTKEFNDLLSNRMNELSGIIENDAKPVVTAIESAGKAVNNKITSTHNQIANESNVLFARLGDSTDLLKTLIEKSSFNLGKMQKDLDAGSRRFAESVVDTKRKIEQSSEIAQTVESNLSATSSHLLEGMQKIADNLNEQSNFLQDATRVIDAAQTNFESTLESKQEDLEKLAVGLVARSDEIIKTMSSFGNMITAMIDDVNQRTAGVGGAVSAEVSAAIDDATGRFSEAVEAMRGAAATVRNELDETRIQMRRGVLELPDETHKSATAMRRVVADQVAALQELSEIVQKSGKMLDATAAPTLSAPPQSAQSSEAAAPAQRQFPPRTALSSQSVPPPMPPRNTPLRPVSQQAPAPANAPNVGTQLRGSADPVTAYAPPQAPVNPQKEGWVSDLLRRASTTDSQGNSTQQQTPQSAPQNPARSPLHVVESLNSLSMDIARAIDHETSVDLWERYQRGERNVFTRKLYTMQGQQAFDEISGKYQQEAEFRAAVDRYVDDFEQLLSDVAQNDRDNMMTQTYLTSDTGKVYTMLAHASGRLGNG